MNEPLQEIEGTWEEVAAHEAELYGHQVKLTILDAGVVETQTSKHSDLNTQEAAAPSAIPGKNAAGVVTDVDAFFAGLPTVEDGGELWNAIAQRAAPCDGK